MVTLGLTHSTKYSLMARKYSTLSFGIWVHCLDASLEGAAQNNSVAAREHIKPIAYHRVIDFRLRQQHRELALDRHKFAIAEQLASAKARAVHDDRFG